MGGKEGGREEGREKGREEVRKAERERREGGGDEERKWKEGKDKRKERG